ncbi:MAG TPA: DUF1697 domain-containing protein [Actinocrinis sp.]|jgi:uncharacterized protein (DUF1697 family)|uniref:DUF1697 domain-containing protein n=1 Tax=Actinocrinis sp. TaxID=1920516 RepID=UPI002D53D3BA|nr:DUF1697 domain-containing protein [Actinocrinis sp.]HZU58838.1 DUF1697 domain-containing protein [Actinocrinis sp.]
MTTTAESTTYVALLAAVNVGKRKVPMADLRELLAGLGYLDVRTYLASGNAVFDVPHATADAPDPAAIAARISAALAERFGFEVPCLVRTGAYLNAVIKACPFPAETLEGKQLHAVFYSTDVTADRYADIDQPAFLPEEFRLGEQVMYLYAPNGLGRSELAAALAKPAGRLKGIIATGRNWNTVKALAEMASAAG